MYVCMYVYGEWQRCLWLWQASNRSVAAQGECAREARAPVVGDYVLGLAGMRVTRAAAHVHADALGPAERQALSPLVHPHLDADHGAGGEWGGLDLSLTLILEEVAPSCGARGGGFDGNMSRRAEETKGSNVWGNGRGVVMIRMADADTADRLSCTCAHVPVCTHVPPSV